MNLVLMNAVTYPQCLNPRQWLLLQSRNPKGLANKLVIAALV